MTAPERICPECRSKNYARCDELREDGKHHPGSILRCIECKTTYLDPALAVSPEVAALIAEARREGWNAAIEASAKHVVGLTHSIRLGCFLSADKETDLVLHPIGQCAAAIRALKEETP